MGFDLKGLLVVLAIVVILFGTKRLRNMGGDLGSAIKGFRSAMREHDKDKHDSDDHDTDQHAEEPQVLEHNETHTKSEHRTERPVNEPHDHS